MHIKNTILLSPVDGDSKPCGHGEPPVRDCARVRVCREHHERHVEHRRAGGRDRRHSNAAAAGVGAAGDDRPDHPSKCVARAPRVVFFLRHQLCHCSMRHKLI